LKESSEQKASIRRAPEEKSEKSMVHSIKISCACVN